MPTVYTLTTLGDFVIAAETGLDKFFGIFYVHFKHSEVSV